MAYEGTDEEGNVFRGGEPSPEEKRSGEQQEEDTANGEYDPEKHPDNYIYRM